MFKFLFNLFKPTPQYLIKEDGFYYYKHRGKSRYGGFVEFYYIIIFKKLPEISDQGYNYIAYTTAMFESDRLDIFKIMDAYRLINHYNFTKSSTYSEPPEGYSDIYFKLSNKNSIEFKRDTLVVSLKMGEILNFEGYIAEDYLRLNIALTGFDNSDKLITEKICSLAKFDFKRLG